MHGATNAFGWRLGYGVLGYHGDVELIPRGPRTPWAWRLEAQAGAMHLDRWHWPTVRLGGGIDFQWLVR